MFSYIKLTDETNYEILIKAEGRKQYRYIYGVNEWKPSGLLLKYYTEGTAEYDKFEEISYEETCAIIEKKSAEMEYLRKKCEQMITKTNKLNEYECFAHPQFDDQEINIVAMLYYLYLVENLNINNLSQEGFTKRIIRSLEVLICNPDITNQVQLNNIISNNSASIIKEFEIKILLKKLLPSSPEYKKYQELLRYIMGDT